MWTRNGIQEILQANAWYILFTLWIAYYLKFQFLDPFLNNRHEQISYEEAIAPYRVENFRADQSRIREEQQEETRRKALLAQEEARKKKLQEMEQKVIRLKESKGSGHRLGTMTGTSSSAETRYYRPNPQQRYGNARGG